MSVVRVCPRCSSHIPRGYYSCTECGRSLSGAPEIDPDAPARTISTAERETAAAPKGPPHTQTYALIRGVDIPFGELVWLLVKIGLAAIPATIILAAVWTMAVTIVGGVLLGLANR